LVPGSGFYTLVLIEIMQLNIVGFTIDCALNPLGNEILFSPDTGTGFHNTLIGLKFNPKQFITPLHSSNKFIRNIKTRI